MPAWEVEVGTSRQLAAFFGLRGAGLLEGGCGISDTDDIQSIKEYSFTETRGWVLERAMMWRCVEVEVGRVERRGEAAIVVACRYSQNYVRQSPIAD